MNDKQTRILGVAIRARWLGFAAIDEHTRLIDWGMIYYQRKLAARLKAARRRAESMVARIAPSQIVLLTQPLDNSNRNAAVLSMTRAIQKFAKAQRIQILRSDRVEIRAAFKRVEAQSKHAIAAALARSFPELAWRLPPARKIWKKEDGRLALFDAVAAAVAFEKCQSHAGSAVTPSGGPFGDV